MEMLKQNQISKCLSISSQIINKSSNGILINQELTQVTCRRNILARTVTGSYHSQSKGYPIPMLNISKPFITQIEMTANACLKQTEYS